MKAFLSQLPVVGIENILKSALILILTQACTTSDPQPAALPGNISTIAGIAGEFDYSGDSGPAIAANLGYLTGIAADLSGNIYVVDGAANVIRRIDASTGTITTLAGTFLGFNVIDPTPSKGDGGPATDAHLNVPLGVATDATGNVYIADGGNNIVRKVAAATGVITTIAGQSSALTRL